VLEIYPVAQPGHEMEQKKYGKALIFCQVPEVGVYIRQSTLAIRVRALQIGCVSLKPAEFLVSLYI